MIKQITFHYEDGDKILNDAKYMSTINFSNRIIGNSNILEIVNSEPYTEKVLKPYKTASNLKSVEIVIILNNVEKTIKFNDTIIDYMYYYDFIDDIFKESIEVRFK